MVSDHNQVKRCSNDSTTDHISAAGAWLKYKGHLSNISENTLMTAVNDEGGSINVARDQGGEEDTIPRTMQKYQARSEPWMLVVDDNCKSPSHAAWMNS
jgi:homoaconitase